MRKYWPSQLTHNIKENCDSSREDAVDVISAALADPDTLILDSLLSSKSVQNLKGELIFELLSIFVKENLRCYLHFYDIHKEFVLSLGLNHKQNLHKMRILTFMQLAENNSEIPFDVIVDELQIDLNEVEGFVIEALKTKLIRARMDQLRQKVIIMSTVYRTFGRSEWQQLRDILFLWKSNLTSVQEGLKKTVTAQLRVKHQP